MPKPFQLGRGLSALISPKKEGVNFWGAVSTASESQSLSSDKVLEPLVTSGVQEISLRDIKPDVNQPRKNIEPEALQNLVASIKVHGILQPLVVSPRANGGYDLIAGERRFRAAALAGFKTVPVIIREVSEQKKLALALVENIQREDLNPLEEAVAFKRLEDEFGLTQEAIAREVGTSRAQVANTLRLLTLSPVIQQALGQNKITMGHAKVLMGIDDRAEQIKFFERILSQGLSVRETEIKTKPVRVRSHLRKTMSDPNLKVWEKELSSALGTRVQIKGSRSKGAIEVIYFSDEELEGIVGKIVSH